MLSYMVPSEDKPPAVPLDLATINGHHHQQQQQQQQKRIIKTTSKSSALSAESSASSISSVLQGEQSGLVPATHEKPKRVINGQAKHPSLKRVSFGSSKGSMVETLIYESPLQEEPEPSPPASVDSQGSESSKAAKVRVTFFECERPQTLSSPEPGECGASDADVPFIMTSTESPLYQRQASTDSGWDNPFRPDGDLSREADEIVELIKGGKPITPTAPNGDAPKVTDKENGHAAQTPAKAEASPTAVNGKAPVNGSTPAPDPGQVDVKRATVSPTDASQVERVKLNKKPKCKCCVIQ